VTALFVSSVTFTSVKVFVMMKDPRVKALPHRHKEPCAFSCLLEIAVPSHCAASGIQQQCHHENQSRQAAGILAVNLVHGQRVSQCLHCSTTELS
jgi:hypothetical protein